MLSRFPNWLQNNSAQLTEMFSKCSWNGQMKENIFLKRRRTSTLSRFCRKQSIYNYTPFHSFDDNTLCRLFRCRLFCCCFSDNKRPGQVRPGHSWWLMIQFYDFRRIICYVWWNQLNLKSLKSTTKVARSSFVKWGWIVDTCYRDPRVNGLGFR